MEAQHVGMDMLPPSLKNFFFFVMEIKGEMEFTGQQVRYLKTLKPLELNFPP